MVRNISSLGRVKPIKVHVWIPPIYDALHKIEVVRSDGTLDDITDYVLEGEIIDGATNSIGVFSFIMDNSSEEYRGVWIGNEIVNVYIDYATSATTKRFRGRIEKISYQNNQIKIIGRSESVKLLNLNATGGGTGEASVLLKALLSAYTPDFTQNNIDTTTTTMTQYAYQKPVFEVIQEYCQTVSFDFYVDADLDCHFFESGSVKNTTEAVIHDMNIFSVDDFGDEYSEIKNSIRVEGAEIDGTPLLYAAEDTGSTYGTNSELGIRELIIKDENIITRQQAINRANAELSLALNPNTVGEIECKGLATIQPGQQIRISAPDSNLPPAYYTIISYTHKFEGEMRTILTINKEKTKISEIMKERISREQKAKQISNPYGCKYSWNFDFESDTGDHSNTQITDSVLKLSAGQSSGTWISESFTAESNLTLVQLKLNGTSLAGTKVFLSTDGGITDTQIWGVGWKTTFPSEKNLKLRVSIGSANTQIDGMALLYL